MTAVGQTSWGARPTRIILVEDDVHIRQPLAQLLVVSGYHVDTACHGAQLLDYLGSWILGEERAPPADVIVTDVRMPGFSGLTIVEGLRECGWTLPIFVISAFADQQMRQRIEQLGDVQLFAKPFDPCQLERSISRALAAQAMC